MAAVRPVVRLSSTAPRRIHITGGPGSGKSTLAARVAATLGVVPVHLDEVARVGGGVGVERPVEERLRTIRDIVERPVWVTEGVHLGWTDDLLRSADVVIWLDDVPWTTAAVRIVKRFLSGALAESRRQRGLRRIGRFRDYWRQLVGLVRAIPEARRYHALDASQEPLGRGSAPTQAMIRSRLEAHGSRVLHVRRPRDADRFVQQLASSTLSSPTRPRGPHRADPTGR